MADLQVGATLQLSFPTLSQRFHTVSARLIQAAGAHDVLQAKLANADGIEALFDGAPAVARWTTETGAEGAFHGYVHRADASYRRSQGAASVLLVGASYPLMQPGSASWVEVRASDVVRDVAFRFGLACDVEEHPRVYPQVIQAGMSFWQLLTQLAEETGFVLRMEGATLVFRSRQSLMAHFRPMAPQVETGGFSSKVGNFNPELGATQAVRAASGVDPYRGDVVADRRLLDPTRALEGPLSDQLVVDAVVHNQLDASTAVAAAQEANRFTRQASLSTWGNPYLQPERVVWPTMAPDELRGYWVVRRAEHVFERGRYSTQAELATDGLGASLREHGEPARRPSASADGAVVDPHRPGALAAWSDPVLRSTNDIQGSPGRALVDYAWIAPATESRTQ